MPTFEAASPAQLAQACQAVPLFPLPSVVLLPNTIMPLHVFEERYRDLVRDCLDTELKLISVPLLATGWEQDYNGTPPIHQTAGLGQIIRHERLSDGRYNIVLLGVARIDITNELSATCTYRIAQANLREDQLPPAGVAGLTMQLQQLRMLLGQLIMKYPRLQPELGHFVERPDPPPALIDALAHLVFPEPDTRQRYIEEDRLATRADLVLTGLADIIARATSDVPEA